MMQEQELTRSEEEIPLMPKPTQQVAKLKEGTVLDHLRAGTGLRCLRVLNLPPGTTVTIGINLTSKRLEKKDMLQGSAPRCGSGPKPYQLDEVSPGWRSLPFDCRRPAPC